MDNVLLYLKNNQRKLKEILLQLENTIKNIRTEIEEIKSKIDSLENHIDNTYDVMSASQSYEMSDKQVINVLSQEIATKKSNLKKYYHYRKDVKNSISEVKTVIHEYVSRETY